MLDELYHPIYPEQLPIPSKKRRRSCKTYFKRRSLWEKDNRCSYCKRALKFEEATLDHRIPRSKGGDNTWENVALACWPCNNKKGVKSEKEFLALLSPLSQPLRSFGDLQQFIGGRS